MSLMIITRIYKLSPAVAVVLITIACHPQGESVGPSAASEAAATTVTIHRDSWGVPHIFAEQEEHGFYGLGYAQAADQLERLLGSVYLYQGRLSELQGESSLATDIELRRWRHVSESITGVQRLEPQVLKNYQQFVAGVNRFMADHPDAKPDWAPTLDVADPVGISRAILWLGYATTAGPAECRTNAELHASIEKFTKVAPERASNGWVLAPARTENGSTLLLADPHVAMQNAVYYEYRLHAGALESAGFAMGPLLWQAHNRNVSWAMTTGNPDLWDCYEVDVDPEQPTRYLFDGEWQEMEQIDEKFQVLDGEVVTQTFEYTRHNGVLSPVVARRGNKAYAVSTSQMHDTGIFDNEIHKMNLAGNISELQQSMQFLGMFPQNIIAGDSSGHIWYLRAGKTPIRPAGYDFTRPVPGNDSATAWLGYYRLDDMVQLHNPRQGYLQNNNVASDAMFASDNLSADDYAPGLFYDTPGRITTRGVRGIEVLANADKFTAEDAMQLAFDETWVTAAPWIRALNYALQKNPNWLHEHDGEAASLVRRLIAFDGVAAADSIAALNFFYWHKNMGEVLRRPGFEALQSLPWKQEDFSPEFAAAILQQAEVTAKLMVEQYGSTALEMGSVFRVGLGERSWPLGGETLAAGLMPTCVADISPLCDRTQRAFESGQADDQGQRRAYRGSQAIRLVEFSTPIRSWSLGVHGQSDDPASSHYDDQAALLSRREFKPVFFDRKELEGNIETTLTLTISDGHD